MRLTVQTDYAIRSLMYIASRNERVTAAEIAAFFRISLNHVSKVVNHLARLGYIRSIRGIGGGLELARPAGEITIGEVIEAIEGSAHLLDCLGMDNVCAIESFCSLKQVLAEAERIQRKYLRSVSLADVVPSGRQQARVSPRRELKADESHSNV